MVNVVGRSWGIREPIQITLLLACGLAMLQLSYILCVLLGGLPLGLRWGVSRSGQVRAVYNTDLHHPVVVCLLALWFEIYETPE